MDLNCFYLLLVGHLLGDYYLQWGKMSDEKDRKWSYLLIHSAIYMAVCVFLGVIAFSVQLFYTFLLLATSHFFIDSLKKLVKPFLLPSEKNKQSKLQKLLTSCAPSIQANPQITDKYVYIIDQLLHLGFIFLFSCLFISWGGKVSLTPAIHTAIDNLGLSSSSILRWVVILLLIGKPVNVTIKKVIVPFKPTGEKKGTLAVDENTTTANSTNDEKLEKILNAGAFIGFLERLIIVALLSLQQYASIGLVLTAKSIVRYSEISKDSAFADYYLLGTLMSILSAICFYLLIFS